VLLSTLLLDILFDHKTFTYFLPAFFVDLRAGAGLGRLALGSLVGGFVVPVLVFPLRGLVPAPVPPVVGFLVVDFLVVDFPVVGFPGVDFPVPVVGFLVPVPGVGFLVPVPVVGFPLVGGGVVGSEQDFSGGARRPRIKSIARRNGRRAGGAQAWSLKALISRSRGPADCWAVLINLIHLFDTWSLTRVNGNI